MAVDTSIIAFEKAVASGRVGETLSCVVYALRDSPTPLTQTETWKVIGGKAKKDSYGPRFAVLRRDGWIVKLKKRKICSDTGALCGQYTLPERVKPEEVELEEEDTELWVALVDGEIGYAATSAKMVRWLAKLDERYTLFKCKGCVV